MRTHALTHSLRIQFLGQLLEQSSLCAIREPLSNDVRLAEGEQRGLVSGVKLFQPTVGVAETQSCQPTRVLARDACLLVPGVGDGVGVGETVVHN